MKVAILCGGKGTRIREVSEATPKPMLSIGNKPILWHIMKIYGAYGINEFVLLLGYKGEIIRDYFLNLSDYISDVTIDFSKSGSERMTVHDAEKEPWKITFIDTGDATMTGGRIWKARKYLETERSFCLTYGDGVGDVDIHGLLGFHAKHEKCTSVTGVQPPGRFGEIRAKGEKVFAFNEKPQVTAGHINGGFMVCNSDIFRRYLTPVESEVFEAGPVEKMVKDGELMMFEHQGFWQAMDTPREYSLLNELWNTGKAPWKTWDRKERAKKAA